MSDQKFVVTHNLVAFLEKPIESKGIEEIVDFLNVNPIKYALTINPTIYCSCIKQFWDTVKAKTVNGEAQLQALVDKKKVIIIECTIRRDLQLEDAEGTECIPTATIFEELTRMGMVKNVDSMVKFWMYPSGPTKPMAYETENVESVPTHSNDPLLNGEDSLKLNELMELFTNLQKKVLDLETTKTIQTLDIDSLKRRVKKLKKKQKSKTHKLKRLYKVGLSAKVISSDDKASLGDQEDASKQGRKILDIVAAEDITLDSTHFDTDPDMLGVHDLHGDQVFVETQEPVVNAATTTSIIPISIATATTTTVDELTLAQTLIKIKAAKPKVRGVMIQEPSETITTTITPATSKPLQDKGKAKN
ncbi:hypothetical protein Tco_0216125 [Tanacetum coccineum]